MFQSYQDRSTVFRFPVIGTKFVASGIRQVRLGKPRRFLLIAGVTEQAQSRGHELRPTRIRSVRVRVVGAAAAKCAARDRRLPRRVVTALFGSRRVSSSSKRPHRVNNNASAERGGSLTIYSVRASTRCMPATGVVFISQFINGLFCRIRECVKEVSLQTDSNYV